MAEDTRIVYGANCVWWGRIQEVSRTKSGLPCCPHCGSVLFEVPSEREWWANVDAHESKGNLGYRSFVEWLHNHHYLDMFEAKTDYERGKN